MAVRNGGNFLPPPIALFTLPLSLRDLSADIQCNTSREHAYTTYGTINANAACLSPRGTPLSRLQFLLCRVHTIKSIPWSCSLRSRDCKSCRGEDQEEEQEADFYRAGNYASLPPAESSRQNTTCGVREWEKLMRLRECFLFPVRSWETTCLVLISYYVHYNGASF
ncbi:hypothetical protein J6590_001208 [Homalodisca vitripennis]|nr:hypothetical protein J6590_001208 [Homalodisca vitripennis]